MRQAETPGRSFEWGDVGELTKNQHQTTEAGPPRRKGVLKVVATEEATAGADRVQLLAKRRSIEKNKARPTSHDGESERDGL